MWILVDDRRLKIISCYSFVVNFTPKTKVCRPVLVRQSGGVVFGLSFVRHDSTTLPVVVVDSWVSTPTQSRTPVVLVFLGLVCLSSSWSGGVDVPGRGIGRTVGHVFSKRELCQRCESFHSIVVERDENPRDRPLERDGVGYPS